MGYQDITLYRLKFEKRDGLEVTAEGVSTGDLLEVMDLTAKMPSGAAAAAVKDMTPDMKASMNSMMSILAGALVEWNIEDRNGKPVPMTAEGLKSLKLPLVMDIITAWVSAQADVDAPLPPSSSGGETPGLELSIPMTSRGS